MRLQVDAIHFHERAAAEDTQVDIQGVVIDRTPTCGLFLTVHVPDDVMSGGPGVQVDVKPGDMLRFAQRLTFRSAHDVLGTKVIARDDGQILLAVINGARPDSFDADLVPGLGLMVKKNLCVGGTNEARVGVRLGPDECWIDSRSQRCCKLRGQDYEVQSQAAVADLQAVPTMRPWAHINVALRKVGFIMMGRE